MTLRQYLPVTQLGGEAYTRIELVAGVKGTVEISHRRLCLIQVTDIMLRRITPSSASQPWPPDTNPILPKIDGSYATS